MHEEQSMQADSLNLVAAEAEMVSTTTLLATTVECCQQLAERLKKKEGSVSKPGHSKVLSEEKMDEKTIQQSALEENIRLRAILQDVTDANKRWQKHNEQCQAYIEKLKTTIQELREQPKNPSEDSSVLPAETSSDESAALKLSNGELSHKIRQLQRELDECRVHLSTALSTLENVKEDHKEHVRLLEMQIEGHRADWEAEANEKKQLQRKISEMQEDILMARAKIYRLQHPGRCTCEMRNGIHTEPIQPLRPHSSPITYNIPPDTSLIPRSHGRHNLVCCDGGGRVESDGAEEEQPEAKGYSFVCPECQERFPPERHSQFLEHFDQCQKEEELNPEVQEEQPNIK